MRDLRDCKRKRKRIIQPKSRTGKSFLNTFPVKGASRSLMRVTRTKNFSNSSLNSSSPRAPLLLPDARVLEDVIVFVVSPRVGIL